MKTKFLKSTRFSTQEIKVHGRLGDITSNTIKELFFELLFWVFFYHHDKKFKRNIEVRSTFHMSKGSDSIKVKYDNSWIEFRNIDFSNLKDQKILFVPDSGAGSDIEIVCNILNRQEI